MTVYVDDARLPFGRMIMSHMWADTEAEMIAMAGLIGVQAKWIQRPPKASWVHFDISLGMKAKAIKQGAVLTDRYGPLEHTAKLMIATGDPKQIGLGKKRLEMVAECRATHDPEFT